MDIPIMYERNDNMSLFSGFADLGEIFEKYNCGPEGFVNMQIGSDKKLYFLFNEKIPERIDGMFVPTTSDSRYCIIVLDIDWDNEDVMGEQFYDLGTQKMNYHFVQPMNGGFLLVASRCYCRNGIGENNAALFDKQGRIISQFCLGDGIEDVIVLSDGRIVTSYFDEGVFGNYGWDVPLGASGLVVWDKDGNIVWEADSDICDCYALNIDNSERLWYYYYTEFNLVCTDLQKETVYQPDISGACMFILTADGQSVIFDKGYDDHGSFVKERFIDGRLSEPEDMLLDYDGGEISPWRYTSRGSLAAFIDNEYRLFVKDFIIV